MTPKLALGMVDSLTCIGAADAAAAPMPEPRLRSRGLETCQAVYDRAMLLWPRLDRSRLARTHGDPRKIARLVARRTNHSEESILLLLQV